MNANERDPEAMAGDLSAIEEAERQIDELVNSDGFNLGAIMLEDIPRLLTVLERARREDPYGLVDVAFGMAVATGVEMLTRAVLALRYACHNSDHRADPVGREFPPVEKEAERVANIMRFLTDIGRGHARIAHLSHLAKRRNADPRIVDFRAAKEQADQAKAREGQPQQADAGS